MFTEDQKEKIIFCNCSNFNPATANGEKVVLILTRLFEKLKWTEQKSCKIDRRLVYQFTQKCGIKFSHNFIKVKYENEFIILGYRADPDDESGSFGIVKGKVFVVSSSKPMNQRLGLKIERRWCKTIDDVYKYEGKKIAEVTYNRSCNPENKFKPVFIKYQVKSGYKLVSYQVVIHYTCDLYRYILTTRDILSLATMVEIFAELVRLVQA